MKKIIFGTIFVTLALLAFSSFSFAQTENELRDQISTANSQIDKINKEIEALSNQIAITSEQKNTLATAIKTLTLERNKLIKERQQTEKKISATGLVIKSLSNEITTKSEILDKSKESLSSLIKDLNEQDKITFLQKVLAEDDLESLSREYNNTISLNQNIKDHIQKVSLQKNNLTVSKDKKENEQDLLNTLKKTITAKEMEISANKKEKDSLLIATKNKESEYQKMLAEQLKRKEAFEKSIEDYEAQLSFILNPKLIPKEGSGVLSWPLSSVLITSPYGSRWGKFHYGLDFRAKVGTNVYAMASGTVEGTGDTDIACKGASFGKWVFIRYENGLSSTYGHLSSIKATVGEKIKAGDIVALSGNTGSSTGPHLHVAVYASGGVKVDTVPSKACNGKIFTQPIAALSSYLNPALYLPKLLASMIKN
ncbi:peptidoglycan DD-metalloendopeptidase family protein [Candidatus Nomurabacteria bacterium]|nr:peptidoglycan DD-metalloendopeptidase family protein [Candidatus Nomurabacteria bacterium]